MMRKMRISAVLAVMLVMSCLTQAAVVYTSGTSDGVGIRSQWMGGSWTNTSTDGDMLSGYYYYYGGADRGFSFPVMQFSLAPFKNIADTTDLTASLKFYIVDGSNINWAYVRFYDADGTGEITYAQSNGGSKVGDNLAGAGWQTIDVTAQVKTALSKDYNWITFNVAMPNWDMGVNIVSSEGATGAYAGMGPQLSVSIPEPATLTILGTGLLGLLRRKK